MDSLLITSSHGNPKTTKRVPYRPPPGFKVIWRGGRTAAQLIKELESGAVTIKQQYKRIFILLGSNDMDFIHWSSNPKQATAALRNSRKLNRDRGMKLSEDLHLIYKMLEVHAAVEVVIMNLIPRPRYGPVYQDEITDRTNSVISRYLSKNGLKNKLVNLHQRFFNPLVRPTADYFDKDQIHLSTHGYKQLNNALTSRGTGRN